MLLFRPDSGALLPKLEQNYGGFWTTLARQEPLFPRNIVINHIFTEA
jgi:hypothetical protein